MTLGSVVPLLDASPRSPLDMLLIVDKRRLRALAPGTSFLPFDAQAKITVAADGPDGLLVTLDADKGILWISRGDATSAAIRLARVPDVARARLTLARRLDGRGLSLVGYSASTGEVFAGDIDLARAEIGPLTALGRLDAILEAGSGACAAGRASRRFLADVPSVLDVLGKGDQRLFEGSVIPLMLLEADGERLCAVGFEVGIPKVTATDLTVTFGKGGGAAAVRSQATKGARGTCAITPGK